MFANLQSHKGNVRPSLWHVVALTAAFAFSICADTGEVFAQNKTLPKNAAVCMTLAGLDELIQSAVNNDAGQAKRLFAVKECGMADGRPYSLVRTLGTKVQIRIYAEDTSVLVWTTPEMIGK